MYAVCLLLNIELGYIHRRVLQGRVLFTKECTVKHATGVLLFVILIMGAASPAGAYQYINSGADNCQNCHAAKFADGTAWHDEHQAYTGCSTCHGGIPDYAAPMETSVCSACHANVPCAWVTNHPDPPRATCLQCHVQCNPQPAGVSLSADTVALPCSDFGVQANLPLRLTAAGASIAAVSADITFDEEYFEFLGATIGAAGTAAGKSIVTNMLAPGKVRIGVFSTANTTVIGDGVVAIVNFRLLKNPVGGVNIGIAAGASDPNGAPVVITSTTTGGFFTVKTGDTDMDGTVEINEVVATIAMFLSLQTVNPICDVNGDGIVQISDVVKVINCALETPTCACEVTPAGPREEEEWQGSGHADSGAMAFNDWNDVGTVPSGCAKCHSTPGYVNYVRNPAQQPWAYPRARSLPAKHAMTQQPKQ